MQKMARRDSISIMTDLLENMNEQRRMTHLQNSTNLSYKQFLKYLKLIKDMGLVEEKTKPHRSYLITQEGKAFVEMAHKRKEKVKISVRFKSN